MDVSIAEWASQYEWSEIKMKDIKERPGSVYYKNAVTLIKDGGQIIED